MTHERFHSLDALRAFALLLGICIHSALPFILPPGFWVVGTTEPAALPGLAVYYIHSFRMELFFLLAGFFARLVIEKRGVRAFLKDRAIRIGLVFLVALYPTKFLLAALWMIGGKYTGWLQLPPEVAALSWWQLALGALQQESFPNLNLAHLWFLYYLLIITTLFLCARWLLGKAVAPESAVSRFAQSAFRRVLTNPFAPLAMVVCVLPLLLFMDSPDVDTPDRTLLWHWPVTFLYGLFFTIGWALHRQSDLLAGLGRRWKAYLTLSLSLAAVGGTFYGLSLSGSDWAKTNAQALRWATASSTALTMSLAVFGWLGVFVRFFGESREWVRYLADSSYWIYLVHLPFIVALQIALAKWAAPWWVKWPLINAIAFPVLLLSYHLCVRYTWIGKWLNGKRATPPPSSGG